MLVGKREKNPYELSGSCTLGVSTFIPKRLKFVKGQSFHAAFLNVA